MDRLAQLLADIERAQALVRSGDGGKRLAGALLLARLVALKPKAGVQNGQ